jgi:peroxiredoxin
MPHTTENSTMLFMSPTAARSSESGLEHEHKQFVKEYGLIAQTLDHAERKAKAETKIQTADDNISTDLPGFTFGFRIDDLEPRTLYSEMLQNLGVLFLYVPGPHTPVCEGQLRGFISSPEKLKQLKKLGVDSIVVVSAGIPDATQDWVYELLGENNLQHLMPRNLPQKSVDHAGLLRNTEMPTFMGIGDQTLAFINSRGLVIEGRLGIMPARAAEFFKNGKLEYRVVTATPSLQECGPVLIDEIAKELAQPTITPADNPLFRPKL